MPTAIEGAGECFWGSVIYTCEFTTNGIDRAHISRHGDGFAAVAVAAVHCTAEGIPVVNGGYLVGMRDAVSECRLGHESGGISLGRNAT